MIQAVDFAKALNLTVLSPSTKTEWDIRSTDLNRPGMQFCGFYEYYAFERPQVIGKVEMTYLENLEPEVRRERLQKYFSYDLPCVIICRGMQAPHELLEEAAARTSPCIRRRWSPPASPSLPSTISTAAWPPV